VKVYEGLAATNPQAFEPDLAASLSNLGIRHSELGLETEAGDDVGPSSGDQAKELQSLRRCAGGRSDYDASRRSPPSSQRAWARQRDPEGGGLLCAGARPATAQMTIFVDQHRKTSGSGPIRECLPIAPSTYHTMTCRVRRPAGCACLPTPAVMARVGLGARPPGEGRAPTLAFRRPSGRA